MTSDTDDRHAWERAGTWEVAPGVHRIPLPLPGDGLKAVNVYAVSDGDGVVCIDGGWALEQSAPLLEQGLNAIGYEARDVREYLVTHMHRDHWTNALTMRRLHGSTVALGEGERAALEVLAAAPSVHPDAARLAGCGADELSRQVAGFDFPADPIWRERPDRWLADGVEVPLRTRTLRVLNTPGHTIGHMVFHDVDNSVLFAGDHVLPHITPSIGVEANRRPSPLRDYLASLDLVRALPDARLLPAHGPVTDSVHARIEELLQHHADRLDETLTAVLGGRHTPFDVAGALGWTRRKHRLADMDTFNQVLAVFETLAHLRVLVERGLLVETAVGGVDHFAAP